MIPIDVNCIFLNGIMDHHDGIIKYLVEARHPGLFESTVVKAILEFKWHKYAKRTHLWNLSIYASHALIWVSYSVVTYNPFWEDPVDVETGEGTKAHKDILGILAGLFSVRYLMVEVKKAFRGNANYLNSGWNLWSLFSYALLIVAILLEFSRAPCEPHATTKIVVRECGRHSGASRNVAAMATLLVWGITLYYLRGFRGTGALVRMILQVLKDMKYFILIMSIMTIAFVQVYFILKTAIVQEDQPHELLWVLYNAAWLGEFQKGFGASPILDRIMFALMTVFMVVVLLNLLIAIMSDTFVRVQKSAIVEFYHVFAELIHELEMLMTTGEHKSPKFFPKYMVYSIGSRSIRADVEGEGAGDEEDSDRAKASQSTGGEEVGGQAAAHGPQEMFQHQILAELKALQRSHAMQQQVLQELCTHYGLSMDS
eukprot:gnl/TRDRNA2_/TRDRNA2_176673_c2_seq2.p1 gnl/TRDRNA2_/TRDRNA2_176673_c2~~gnl/TRDRNA2_/TRDRNA2_176673_c2_seq2.p1  ORF type:complete len:476 (-),score=83.50 gnl/TRDRNA2_/TRDRNA2_176673_c2_seq2:76-1356(-)